MSQENVEAFERATEATNRGDVGGVLEEVDPAIEFHAVVAELVGGQGMVYRGHDGIRKFFRDFDEALAELHFDYAEIRDLGDRTLAIGRIRIRGRASGATAESPFCALVDWRNGKATRVLSFLDPEEGLEAAGLRE
jgi:ketosteroid isomerase-like protein